MPRRGRFLIASALAGLALASHAAPLRAQDSARGAPREASNVSSATLSLAVVLDGLRIGSASATITEDEILAIDAEQLAALLDPHVAEGVAVQLRAAGGGLVPPILRPAGLRIGLDPGSLSVIVTLDDRIRRTRQFAASATPVIDGAETVEPARFATGLTGSLIASAPLDEFDDFTSSLAFAGFANLGGVRGINLEYAGLIDLAGLRAGAFQRGRIAAFKDWPDEALRLEVGDTLPQLPVLAGRTDLLGVTLTRDFGALQPLRNIRPTLARSIVLDQRSIVEVYVNQALVERFQAGPGPIDITQIPLAQTSNDVSIVVEDALGRREVDSLVTGSDLTLLGQGIESFGISAGLLRRPGAGLSYTNDPALAGYYRRGLSLAVTAGAHAALAERVQNVGLGAGFATRLGLFSAEAALSRADGLGEGFALTATYRGSPFPTRAGDDIATVSFDYRSRDFVTIDRALGSNFGIDNIVFDLRADYERPIGGSISMVVAYSQTARRGIAQDDRAASLGVRFRAGPAFVNAGLRYLDLASTGADYGVFASLSLPLGRDHSVTSSYDSAGNRVRAELRRRPGFTLPEIDYRVGIGHDDEEISVFGGAGFANTRIAADVDVLSRMQRGRDDFTSGTLRLQSGIGYADGVIGIGRDPGRGFALFSRHESISDAQLAVRASAIGRELGFANAAGPGLVSLATPYRPQVVSIEASGVPAGYDIGAGRYLLVPGALSGFHVEIGTDAYRSALANLTYAGEPVALANGRIERIDAEAVPGSFFTNRAGRAAFSALSPGRYRIVIDALRLEGEFELAEDAPVMTRLGSIEMRRQ